MPDSLPELDPADLSSVPVERSETIPSRVQQGLGSRAYDRGRFSVQFDEGVYHFQQLLKDAYREWQAGR